MQRTGPYLILLAHHRAGDILYPQHLDANLDEIARKAEGIVELLDG